MRHSCFLCIGSNLPSRMRRLDCALKALASCVSIIDVSDSIESPDFSGIGANYLNITVQCSTDLSLDDLREAIRDIEIAHGRRDDSKASGRMPIDIDIVTFDDIIVSPCDFNRPYFSVCYRQLLNS
ncbi:MAG: 2-amino-4-hydroxy-6-hydroxymethyldihydropteridine diphosphokinase [Muribaculaceae bacterium]